MCGLPYITCEGVSEDDEIAIKEKVGIALPDLSSPISDKQLIELQALLAEDKAVLRERCRAIGISYRSRVQADLVFDEILEEV